MFPLYSPGNIIRRGLSIWANFSPLVGMKFKRRNNINNVVEIRICSALDFDNSFTVLQFNGIAVYSFIASVPRSPSCAILESYGINDNTWPMAIRVVEFSTKLLASCQKVPKFDFQSQFSMSKVIGIFLIFFSLKNTNLRKHHLFFIDIFW